MGGQELVNKLKRERVRRALVGKNGTKKNVPVLYQTMNKRIAEGFGIYLNEGLPVQYR